jgi:outer membrane autotransporter protein
MVVTPRFAAAWQHAFDDLAPPAGLAFQSTGIGFTVTGVPLAEDSLLLEGGLDLNVSDNTTLGVSYTGQLADDVQENAVTGRFKWRF